MDSLILLGHFAWDWQSPSERELPMAAHDRKKDRQRLALERQLQQDHLELQHMRRALFFWTARRSLALILMTIIVAETALAVITGHRPVVVRELLDLVRALGGEVHG
jgi:hypothetical protein